MSSLPSIGNPMSNPTVGVSSASSPTTGKLQSHTVVPFTYYFLIVGSVVGVIAALAAAIFVQIPIIVAGAVLTVFCTIGAVEVKRMSFFQDVSEVNKDLNQENQTFYKDNLELKKNIDELKKEREAFAKEKEDFKKAVADNEKKVQEKTKKIKDLIEQINISQKELNKFPVVFDKLNKAMTSFGDLNKTFLLENQKGLENLSKLVSTASELRLEEDKIDDIGKSLNTQIKNFKSVLENAATVIPQFSKIVESVQKKCNNLDVENKKLKEQIKLFKEANDVFTRNIEDMKKREQAYKEFVNKFQNTVDWQSLQKKLDEEIKLLKEQKKK